MNLFDDFSIALLLTLIGSLLVVAEVFFPSGGMLGAFAGLSFIAAIYSAYQSGGWFMGLSFATAEVLIAPAMIYLAFQILPHTPMGRVLIGRAPTAEEVAVNDRRADLVGRVGIARSKLLPAGAVEIDGQMIDCVSQSQAIDPGEYVKVVEVSANRVVVRRADRKEQPMSLNPDDLLARPAKELGLEELGLEDLDLS